MGYFTVLFPFIIIILKNAEMIVNDDANQSPWAFLKSREKNAGSYSMTHTHAHTHCTLQSVGLQKQKTEKEDSHRAQ